MSAPAVSPLTAVLLLFAATTRSQSNDGETPVLLSPARASSGFEERFEPDRTVVPTFMRPEVISTVSVLSSQESAGGDAIAPSPMPVSGQEDAVAVAVPPPSPPPPLPHARPSDGEAVTPLRQTATPTETASTPAAQVRPKRRSIAKPKPGHLESRSRRLGRWELHRGEKQAGPMFAAARRTAPGTGLANRAAPRLPHDLMPRHARSE
jgi:hypothetical protein